MIFPPRLSSGDEVALIAPSSHQTRKNQKLVQEAIEVLTSWGLKVHLQAEHDAEHFYLAGTDAHRAQCFQDFYTNPNIKALFTTRGGYGASRLLRHLSPERLRSHQKIVVGYSDITSLLLYLQQVCKTVVFHGPCLATPQFLSALPHHETQSSLYNWLFQESYSPEIPISFLKSGSASGVLTGGCLSLLVGTLGTPHALDAEGKILFIEEVNEAPYCVDRMFTHLRNAGKMEHIKGLIFGAMQGCEGEQNDVLWQIILDMFQDAEFPIAYGLPSGHGEQNLTLPLGLPVHLDANEKVLKFIST